MSDDILGAATDYLNASFFAVERAFETVFRGCRASVALKSGPELMFCKRANAWGLWVGSDTMADRIQNVSRALRVEAAGAIKQLGERLREEHRLQTDCTAALAEELEIYAGELLAEHTLENG